MCQRGPLRDAGFASARPGGILTSELSWRWVFFVNIPIRVIAGLAAVLVIGESRDPEAGGFDLAGAASVTAGIGALVRVNPAVPPPAAASAKRMT